MKVLTRPIIPLTRRWFDQLERRMVNHSMNGANIDLFHQTYAVVFHAERPELLQALTEAIQRFENTAPGIRRRIIPLIKIYIANFRLNSAFKAQYRREFPELRLALKQGDHTATATHLEAAGPKLQTRAEAVGLNVDAVA